MNRAVRVPRRLTAEPGMPAERVRRMEGKTLRKLRHQSRAGLLQDFPE